MTDTCGYWMPRSGAPCARRPGHPGRHEREAVLEARNAGRRAAAAERSAWLAAYKLERGCADCGYREHSSALDFDHTDRSTKVGDVAKIASRSSSWEALYAEVAKCIVRCANCHRIKTHSENAEAPRRNDNDEGLLT